MSDFKNCEDELNFVTDKLNFVTQDRRLTYIEIEQLKADKQELVEALNDSADRIKYLNEWLKCEGAIAFDKDHEKYHEIATEHQQE